MNHWTSITPSQEYGKLRKVMDPIIACMESLLTDKKIMKLSSCIDI